MRIYRLQSNCGGYRKPKGHLDTQMFPECANTPADRDVVKKTRERREKGKKKKKASIEVVDKTSHQRNECPFCGNVTTCRCSSKIHDQTGVITTHDLCETCKEASIKTASKKKDNTKKYDTFNASLCGITRSCNCAKGDCK